MIKGEQGQGSIKLARASCASLNLSFNQLIFTLEISGKLGPRLRSRITFGSPAAPLFLVKGRRDTRRTIVPRLNNAEFPPQAAVLSDLTTHVGHFFNYTLSFCTPY